VKPYNKTRYELKIVEASVYKRLVKPMARVELGSLRGPQLMG
jgi:hypothetical protein